MTSLIGNLDPPASKRDPSFSLASGNRFEALDGLRGVAAVAVLFYHSYSIGWHPFTHGYLAVDLFFGLSGFVIGAVYERRMSNPWIFAKTRIIRLYPLLLFGTLLGYVLGVLGLTHGHPRFMGLIRQLFLIFQWRPHSGLYPLDNVQWSLFYEILINIAHFSILRKLRKRTLLVIAIFSASGIVASIACYGSLDVGNDVSTMLGGFARVCFSYTTGLIVWRMFRDGQLPEVMNGWALALLLLLVCLCLPLSTKAVAGNIQDALSVFIVFPVVIVLSLRRLTSASLIAIFSFLGELSYPIYMIQIPILETTKTLIGWYPRSALLLGICAILLVFAAAYAGLKLYDEPTRTWLRTKFLIKPQRVAITVP